MNIEKLLAIIGLTSLGIFSLYEKIDSAIVPAVVAAILAIVHTGVSA